MHIYPDMKKWRNIQNLSTLFMKSWLIVPRTGLNTKNKSLLKYKLSYFFGLNQPQNKNMPK